jgi:hemerythrin
VLWQHTDMLPSIKKEIVMPIVEWQDTFSIGIYTFDAHHKHLIMLLNTFYDDFDSGSSEERLAILIDDLINYAKYHFDAEEEWMKMHEYFRYAEHREQHEFFIKSITGVQKDVVKDKKSLSYQVLIFLFNWFTNHILIADAEFGRITTAGPS